MEHILLEPTEMARADEAAAASGISSYGLMERAGAAVAANALRHYPGARCYDILCGPGNNGGDGYVAARHLRAAGANVRVFHLYDPATLKGDASRAYAEWSTTSTAIQDFVPSADNLVIDALFGAGLSRQLPDLLLMIIDRVKQAGTPVLAVDLPSGLDGRTGMVRGAAFQAQRTVTFMTRKPAHLLMPGRELCGLVEVFDIGIPRRIIEAAGSGLLWANGPVHWQAALPRPGLHMHKYTRGHLVVFSGAGTKTGAARMTALAGLKAGAGLVTVAAPADALAENAAHLTAIMLRQIEDEAALGQWLGDDRLKSFVLGPGFGAGEKARRFVALLQDRCLVLDADGLTAFKDDPQQLFQFFSQGRTRLVLTPHEGEFARLFPDIAADESAGKVDKARAAARRAHAAIVYKGADTVIAAPDGRALINTNAPVWLATAGSGDVLAGIVGGLLAQGVPAFEAAACGVHMHGEAGKRAGKGLTAEDLARHVAPF